MAHLRRQESVASRGYVRRMNDDRPDADDDLSSAIVAADDTGMIRGEQSIVQAEMDEALESTEG